MEWKAEIGPALQGTRWSLGAFAEASTTLTWQHNEVIVIC